MGIAKGQKPDNMRSHAAPRLLCLLLALILRHARQQMLDKLRGGILAELDRWAFQERAGGSNRAAQLDVSFNVVTRHVVDQDDVARRLPPWRRKDSISRMPGRSIRPPGHGLVLEYARHGVTFRPRELAAKCILTVDAVAFCIYAMLDTR